MAASTNGRKAGRAAAAPGSVTIPLAPRTGYAEAGALLDGLKAHRDTPEVVLDARAVEGFSTAAVLAVVSFLNARPDRTPPAAVLGATGAFVDAFSDLGLFADMMRMEFRT
jgi:hypothetical protein